MLLTPYRPTPSNRPRASAKYASNFGMSAPAYPAFNRRSATANARSNSAAAAFRAAGSVLPTFPIQIGPVCANAYSAIAGHRSIVGPNTRAATHPPAGTRMRPLYCRRPDESGAAPLHTVRPFTTIATLSTGTAV